MKTVFAVLAILVSAPAFAGALDARQYNYEDQANFPRIRGCREGQRQSFQEDVPGFDRKVWVTRTCRNGSYYAKQRTYRQACREGAVNYWEVDANGFSDRKINARFVCINGRYVRQ